MSLNFDLLHPDNTGKSNLIFGIIIAAMVAMVLLGGVKRIGQVTERLVPFMAVLFHQER